MTIKRKELRMNFLVDTKHARGVARWEKTNHLFRVRENGTGLYVDSADFGCSRIYRTDNPRTAIAQFLSEHACTALNIREQAQ